MKATAPLRKWESEHKEMLEPLVLSSISKRKTMEERLKEIRKKAAKAKEGDYRKFQEEIELLEKELCEIPLYPQIWTSDVTPEHLATIMAANEIIKKPTKEQSRGRPKDMFDVLINNSPESD
jgi:hypothetical protein